MQSRLLISAAAADQFPRTGLPEIALVGRSNVGKSSLINALVKQKIARTSAAPGKTRLANYYLVESQITNPKSLIPRELYLVDLPGYGYARGGPDSVEEFEQLTGQYFDLSDPRRRIAGVLQLIDSRHPDLPQDAAAFEWLLRTSLPLAIVATKIDKLKQSEQAQTIKMLEQKYGTMVLRSSTTGGIGITEIWKVIHQWAAAR